MPNAAPYSPRVAVIGCGRWGTNHVRVWSRLGHLAVICDSSPDALEKSLRSLDGVEADLDANAVIARDDVDAVVVATPAVSHAQLALEALRAGKDVLVEKPLAVTLPEARVVVDEARRLDRVLMVGHVLEYHPAFLRLHELIVSGALGQVRYVYSHRLSFGTLRTEENTLWSFAPHDIAMLLRLLGRNPTTVTCHGGSWLSPGVVDVTMMNLSFPGGVRGHVFVSWLHPFKEHRFVVVGSEAMAVIDDTAPWGEKLRLHPHRVDWIDGRIPIADRAEATFVGLDECEPLLAECEHFIECVNDRKAPLTDGQSALRVLEVLAAGEESMLSGSAVELPDDDGIYEAGDEVFVHATATVDPGATVGERTKIWHQVHVSAGAQIGRDCVLGQNVYVGSVEIGDGVRIQNNVSVYDGVTVEDAVFCGPSVVFTNVSNPRSEVERKDEFKPTLVKRGATLGANSTIVCGTTIGRYAFVAAGAVVTRDVPDHALVMGCPARVAGWVSEAGERLEFVDGRAVCPRTQDVYEKRGGCVSRVAPPVGSSEPGRP